MRPFALEEMTFLVVDGGDIHFEHADRFGIGELTEEWTRVVNLEVDQLLQHLRGGKSEVEGEELNRISA